jgi:predicted ATPase
VSVVSPLARSRDVQLSLDALRADSPFVPDPVLAADGTNLAAVINLWRSGYPTKAEQLDDLMHSYVPEVKQALALPVPGQAGTAVRLWFEHTDGNRFDAAHVSDGVLYFTGLVAHVIDAGPGALILMEEPENSIHPRRLHDIVELLRKLQDERGCQFIIATHSPVFIDEFRDDPDAILLFRREQDGTVVRRLTAVPRLCEALGKTNPADMLASGFFNEPF